MLAVGKKGFVLILPSAQLSSEAVPREFTTPQGEATVNSLLIPSAYR